MTKRKQAAAQQARRDLAQAKDRLRKRQHKIRRVLSAVEPRVEAVLNDTGMRAFLPVLAEITERNRRGIVRAIHTRVTVEAPDVWRRFLEAMAEANLTRYRYDEDIYRRAIAGAREDTRLALLLAGLEGDHAD